MMWFGWGFMFMGPLVLVLIAVAIYYAVTSSNRNQHRSRYQHSSYGGKRALEILKARYARGEITKEQFQEMRKEIER